jgi:hypothetical protein
MSREGREMGEGFFSHGWTRMKHGLTKFICHGKCLHEDDDG